MAAVMEVLMDGGPICIDATLGSAVEPRDLVIPLSQAKTWKDALRIYTFSTLSSFIRRVPIIPSEDLPALIRAVSQEGVAVLSDEKRAVGPLDVLDMISEPLTSMNYPVSSAARELPRLSPFAPVFKAAQFVAESGAVRCGSDAVIPESILVGVLEASRSAGEGVPIELREFSVPVPQVDPLDPVSKVYSLIRRYGLVFLSDERAVTPLDLLRLLVRTKYVNVL